MATPRYLRVPRAYDLRRCIEAAVTLPVVARLITEVLRADTHDGLWAYRIYGTAPTGETELLIVERAMWYGDKCPRVLAIHGGKTRTIDNEPQLYAALRVFLAALER